MWARLAGSAVASGAVTLAAINLIQDKVKVSDTQGKKHNCVANRKFDPHCGDFKIFSGSAHPELARNVAKNLGTALQPASIGKFNDGEIGIKVGLFVLFLVVFCRLRR